MDPVKVAGVTDWPIPSNWKEVQSFLGFVNFYWRFIEGFSEHACPLFELMKKDAKWAWGTAKQSAFEGLKQCFASTPILWFADDNLPYWVKADSLDVATGAVLSQQSPEDEKWHPIAFYSKSLSVVE